MGRNLLRPVGSGNATGGTEAAALFYAFAVSPFSPLQNKETQLCNYNFLQ